jgi:hypothetical protein
MILKPMSRGFLRMETQAGRDSPKSHAGVRISRAGMTFGEVYLYLSGDQSSFTGKT